MNFQFNDIECLQDTIIKLKRSVESVLKSDQVILYGSEIDLKPAAVSLIKMLEKVTDLDAHIRRSETASECQSMVLKTNMHNFLKDVDTLLIYLINKK